VELSLSKLLADGPSSALVGGRCILPHLSALFSGCCTHQKDTFVDLQPTSGPQEPSLGCGGGMNVADEIVALMRMAETGSVRVLYFY
jgi:hypothetical protein